MQNSNYVVECGKDRREVPTLDAALRVANELRDFWGLPARVFHPEGHMVASLCASFDTGAEEDCNSARAAS